MKKVASLSHGTERLRVWNEAGCLVMVAKKVRTMVIYGLRVDLENGVGLLVGFFRM